MLARQIISIVPVSETLTPFPRYSYGLFSTSEKINSHKINNFQTLFVKHPGYGVPLRHLRVLSASALSPFFDFLSLCFQNLTNPFSHNHFLFTSMQNPRGVGVHPPRPRFARSSARQFGLVQVPSYRQQTARKTRATPRRTQPCLPFNALYRHSMHRNTVQRKVWSHNANSGRLDVESLGGSAQLFHLWVHLRPAERHNLTSGTEGEECRM